jgi:hypothetical protein
MVNRRWFSLLSALPLSVEALTSARRMSSLGIGQI